MNKIVVGLAPRPNISAVRSKVDCWNKNLVHMGGGGDATIKYQKAHFTKGEAMVQTEKKIRSLDGTNRKVSGKVACGMVH
jgi:hypothetical protein